MISNTTHMQREIEEIPQAVARLLDGSGAVLAEAGRGIRERDPQFVVTVARGSSDHAATFMKYAVELTAGLAVASVGPSIASIYGRKLRLGGSACLAISQSGKSPDIVAMAETARAGGALTIAVTNTADSPLARASDYAIDILAGPERSVAATKTFVNSAVAGTDGALHWRRSASSGTRPLARAFRQGDSLRLDERALRNHREAEIAVHSRPWAVGSDGQRGGAEVQGNLRHACRGL